MKKHLILLMPLVLTAFLLVPTTRVPSARAAGFTGTGLVCLTSSTTATNCPDSAPTIGPFSTGSSFTVGVFINNSQAMGGFLISVKSDLAFLNPISASLGTLIANPTFTSICINGFNGFGTTGGSCSTAADPGGNGPGYDNGPGVVEVSTIDGAGVNDCGNIAPCSGMAFTVTYKAMAATGSTNLFFPTSPPNPVASACGISSVSSPANMCVLVADAGGGTLPENIQGETVCVNKCPSSTATQIYDASTNAPWSGAEVTGASTYDTSGVTVPVSIAPGGSVTYTYFMTGDCTGAGTLESPVGGSLLFGGGVPNSMTVGPLAAGPYSFQAAYSGDSNYLGSTSPCETFTVNKAPTTTTMVLSETVGSGANAVTWTVPSSGGFTLGALLHVSATVFIQIDGFAISGTITYSYITGPLPLGVSPSDYGGPSLSAGSYCVAATYNGDSNYLSSTTSVCFNVASMNLGGGGKAFRD